MSLFKRITLFIVMVLTLVGLITGGVYLMITIGDALPTIMENLQ